MKLYVSLFVVLLMTDACWSQCRNADWWYSFDIIGWSTCDESTEYLTGFWRSDRQSADPIYLLEEARCCAATGPGADHPSTCKNANWWGVLDNKNSWAVCPNGYFMQGLYRTEDHNLYNIEEAHCCKPNNLPDSWLDCYHQNVWISFDNKGWSTCKDGYYMAGIYKGICEKLYCIEYFKCCSMHGSLEQADMQLADVN